MLVVLTAWDCAAVVRDVNGKQKEVCGGWNAVLGVIGHCMVLSSGRDAQGRSPL